MKTYTLLVNCTNCRSFNGEITVSKGASVSDQACPNCLCKSLTKTIVNIRQSKTSKVFKYGTGQPVPPGAKYLATTTNELMPSDVATNDAWTHRNDQKRMVWHYFLVEVEE